MNNNSIVVLADPRQPSHAVNLKNLKAVVKSLTNDLSAESKKYTD